MRLHSAKPGAAGEELVINPARVEGAAAHADGTVIYLGPEEVLVQEPFAAVRDALEEAWARPESVVDQILEPLLPLSGFLPLVVPMAMAEIQKWMQEKKDREAAAAAGEPRAGYTPGSDGPPFTASPVEHAESGELVVCRQCGKGAAAARLCPHCGSVLVGEG